ncbi:hypothetical protein JI747_001690 [Chryseobacterium sp. RG1]|uniref:Lipoprotein n=1 Tax=Chryseobacterium tagetis TaxID=2801334 RepID=A0ABS7ZVZ6_9FLAO|nr:hypothetical protein [Chryseobacterium tagetis]MCA6065871.1 hypothetical protein [Chryseobacterium tagetis]
MTDVVRLIIFSLSILLISCNQTKKEKPINDKVLKSKIISDPTNKLSDKIENLEIEYTVFGCACPNWIRTNDLKSNVKDGIKNLYFYIEPADENLELPVYFDAFRHYLKIKGQFYLKEDYPKGTVESEEPLPKAKVFRYTELQVLDKPNFKADTKVETLVLNYNAISCSCAQWSESKSNKKEYYWLEPANEKLINADHLFNGENLPIQIKVTGQVVSEKGFPKRENLSKTNENEAGKVFRYTTIEVLKK